MLVPYMYLTLRNIAFFKLINNAFNPFSFILKRINTIIHDLTKYKLRKDISINLKMFMNCNNRIFTLVFNLLSNNLKNSKQLVCMFHNGIRVHKCNPDPSCQQPILLKN